jgi:hypothetical protein
MTETPHPQSAYALRTRSLAVRTTNGVNIALEVARRSTHLRRRIGSGRARLPRDAESDMSTPFNPAQWMT